MQRFSGISFLILLMSFITTSGYAVTLKCNVATDIDVPQFNPNESMQLQNSMISHMGIFSSSSVRCRSIKGDTFYGDLKFYAPGVFIGLEETLFVSCPLVSAKRIIKRLQSGKNWSVGGPRLVVGAGLGIDAGVSVNHRLAACVMGTANIQIGAAAGIATLRIDAVKDRNGNAFASKNFSINPVQE